MPTSTCKTCTHFHQHYVLTGEYGFTADCGHCTCHRIKHTRPDVKACASYEPHPEDPTPNRRETIHYLTTKVLDRILNLELPPEIK